MRRENDAETSKQEMTETIVSIRRVAKTVKGGRNMRVSVTIGVGDHNGKVGVGLGEKHYRSSYRRNDDPTQEHRRTWSRQSTDHAGCRRYRSYRRIISPYSSRVRRT